jgi:hypothetical protein
MTGSSNSAATAFAVVDRKTRKPVTGVAVQFKLTVDRGKTPEFKSPKDG